MNMHTKKPRTVKKTQAGIAKAYDALCRDPTLLKLPVSHFADTIGVTHYQAREAKTKFEAIAPEPIIDAPAPGPEILPTGKELIGARGELTMSTREIAELTGKRPDNVLRDADKMLEELRLGGLLKFEGTYRDSQNGQEYRLLNLPKRETLILVSGYSVELRARIIDRWIELETAVARSGSSDFEGQLLRLAKTTNSRIEFEGERADRANRELADRVKHLENERAYAPSSAAPKNFQEKKPDSFLYFRWAKARCGGGWVADELLDRFRARCREIAGISPKATWFSEDILLAAWAEVVGGRHA